MFYYKQRHSFKDKIKFLNAEYSCKKIFVTFLLNISWKKKRKTNKTKKFFHELNYTKETFRFA